MRRHLGFTLFELLIAIAVLSIVLAVTALGVGAWTKNARLTTANALNAEALARLYALAVRNPGNVQTSGDASANLRLDGATLKLCQAAQDCTSAGGSAALWSATLPTNVKESFGSSNSISCMALDNRGLLTNTPVATASAAGVAGCLPVGSVRSITAS